MSMRTNAPKWLDKYGRWQINVSKNGSRKTFTSSTPGRKGCIECQKKADAWLVSGSDDYAIRVSALAERWIEELKLRTSPDYWKQYEGFFRNYITPRIGALRVNSLTAQHLQDVILWAFTHPKSKHRKALSHKTLDNLRDCLSAFIKYARKSGITTLLPEDLRLPNNAKRPQKLPLQPSDIQRLFTSDQTLYKGTQTFDWYIHAYRFTIITGLRPGELAGLQDRRDIDGKYCTIREAVNVHGETTSGKNDRARRSFILPDYALREIEAQRAMLKAAGIISPYLFPNPDGGHIVYPTFKSWWYRYRDFNGLSARTLYEMRHTWFSLNKSAPSELVKMMGGHGKDFDTFGTYGHALAGEAEQMARLVDDALENIFIS